jgi:16S rRNA (adenine1518-N6/adenine1519-N6)-dimethyltransferase
LSEGGFLRPNKRLGQHFLVDAEIPDKIIAAAGFRSADVVLEIGSGRGALTLPLSRLVSRIVAVEKDARLADHLEKRLSASGITNVALVRQDILSFDLDATPLPPSEKLQIIGNLPYNISSPVLEKLIHHRKRLGRAVLMFQREVAERLTAVPCTKGYGAMTLLVRYHASSTCLLPVPRSAFYPIPKVDSMVVELDFERPYPRHGVTEDDFRKTVKGAFSHRRKTLLNSLKGFRSVWTPAVLLKGMKVSGINPKRRAETLNMDEFLSLAAILAVDKRKAG